MVMEVKTTLKPIARPRQRDADRTRQAILRAAQTLFAAPGYSATGVREIAALAGVNSSLVGRYFGAKEQLFLTALDDALSIDPLFETDRSKFAEHVMGIFFIARDIPSPFAMMLLAAADPQVRATMTEVYEEKVITPMAEWLGAPCPRERAAKICVIWTGFLTYWQIIPLPAFDSEKIDIMRKWVIESVQAIVDRSEITKP
jgi:AcrR family transcriptional regulator